MRFIDLHCHLLPGLDDGSTSIVETVEMMRIARQRGTRGIVATPHAFQPVFATGTSIAMCGAFSRTTDELSDLSQYAKHSFLKEMDVYLGSENLITPEFFEALKERKILTLSGSRYLLVEFPTFMPYPLVEKAAEQILESELIPVLAHVERYDFFRRQPERLDELKQRGCVIQVNAKSLEAEGGDEESKLAFSLARRGLLDVIASDGHDLARRRPDVQGAFDYLSREFSEQSLSRWMSENPARILADQDLPSTG